MILYHVQYLGHEAPRSGDVVDRYRYAQHKPRAFWARQDASEQSHPIYTRTSEERKHARHYTERLDRIMNDNPLSPEDRLGTLTHLLEYYALRGLQVAAKSLTIPRPYHLECALAPAPFEEGSWVPREPGVDLLVSHREGETARVREITLGMNIKSYKRTGTTTTAWYGRRIDAPAFDLPIGGWVVSPDGKRTLHDQLHRAKGSNTQARHFIDSMEASVQPFGSFLMHEVASATYAYTDMGERFGHLRRCTPEQEKLFPADHEAFVHTLQKLHNLSQTFVSNGIKNEWIPAYLKAPNQYERFLPPCSF